VSCHRWTLNFAGRFANAGRQGLYATPFSRINHDFAAKGTDTSFITPLLSRLDRLSVKRISGTFFDAPGE